MAKSSKHRTRGATPVDAHIGQKIRARRNLLGLTQTDLANAAGITFQQIQKYERGANRVGASGLQQFSDALGVPPAYFLKAHHRSERNTFKTGSIGMVTVTVSPLFSFLPIFCGQLSALSHAGTWA